MDKGRIPSMRVPMDNSWSKFILEIPINLIDQMFRYETATWNDLLSLIKDFTQLRNEYLGYNLGNSFHVFVDNNNNKYYLSIYDGILCLWDIKDRSLGRFRIGEDGMNSPISKECYDWLKDKISKYSQGIVECSDCGKEIKKDEIAGRYFAGIYCSECWNSKWKYIEARETYD